jgi:hypothetical protein
MNAVESCVEPACMAETKEILYDADTHAWTQKAKKPLRLEYIRGSRKHEIRGQQIPTAMPSSAAMMSRSGELRKRVKAAAFR